MQRAIVCSAREKENRPGKTCDYFIRRAGIKKALGLFTHVFLLAFIIPAPGGVEVVVTEEETLLTRDICGTAAGEPCAVFIILCVLTFPQKEQKEIAYLRNRQKD